MFHKISPGEPSLKRTFVAIDAGMPEPLAGALDACRTALSGEGIRWVRAGRMHLTLKFLGDTPANLIPSITGELQAAASGFENFSLELEGLGVFRSLKHPRVLWAGVRQNTILEGLHAEIQNRLQPYGFPGRSEGFSPHLTLGRMKRIVDPERLKRFLDRMGGVSFGQVSVREVVYFESILAPSGARYRIISRLPLR